MLRLLKRRSSGSAAGKAADHESVDTLSCRFEGSTTEYFEIWVVNLLLMVCSLGVFGPWADARRREYFYSKTSLGKYQLSYSSTPKKAVYWAAARAALLVAFLGALTIQPVWALGVFGVAVLLYPTYRHQVLVDRAAATTYRGHSLSYTGTLKDSYLRLLGWPVVTVALGFLPLGHSLRSSWGYRFEHQNYGEQAFSAKLKLTRLWGLVMVTALVACAAVILTGLIVASGLFALAGTQGVNDFITDFGSANLGLAHGCAFLTLFVMAAWPLAVWKAGLEQVLADGVQLEAGISVDSEINAARLTGLYMVNAIAIVLTLGMAIPWATVRVAHYRVSVTTLLCYADIEEIVGDKGMGGLILKHVSKAPARSSHVVELKTGLGESLFGAMPLAA